MELNNTCLYLLKHLYAQQDYITISALAEQTGKTERSIRYNLNLIDEFLHRKKLPYLSREFARGVRLVHTPQIDKVLQSFLSTSTPYQYKFSTEEREKVLKICLLVGRRQYIPIADLSEWLTVSYGTITADLDNVEKWLAKQNLSLIRRSRMGIQVKGSEQLILRSCLQLLGENITLAEFDRYLCQKPLDNKITLLILNELFAGLDIDFFRDLPKQAEGVLNCMFSDESFGGLTFYLALLAQRHISGVAGTVAVQDKDTSLMKSDEQKAAAMLLETLGERLGITFSEGDCWGLTKQLLCAKSLSNDHGKLGRDQTRSRRLDGVVEEIIDRVERLYHIDFGVARADLQVRLKTHLTPTVYRIRYQKEIVNPVYDDLVARHSQLLKYTAEAIKPLEDYCGAPINDQEVSYIALYFLAAINQQHPEIISRPQVVVACGSGYGTAQVVASQLKRLFDVEVVEVLSGRDVSDLIAKRQLHCDYVVSTVDLPRLPDSFYIKVSPIFTHKDYQNILQFMDAHKRGYSMSPFWEQEGDPEKSIGPFGYISQYLNTAEGLVEIARKFGADIDTDQMKYEFLSVLVQSSGKEEAKEPDNQSPSLKQLLRPHLIRMDVSCQDWREVVAASTASFEEFGYVTEAYKDAIIRNILDFGPGMVMFPGTLISHAAPEDGCKKLGFSFMSLKEPVEFGNPVNDPVRIVFTLATTDRVSHLEALTQLFHMLSEPLVRGELFGAKTKEDILQIIYKFLR